MSNHKKHLSIKLILLRLSVTFVLITLVLPIHAQTDKLNIVKTNLNLSFNTNDLIDAQQNDYEQIISDKTINFKYSIFLGRKFKSNFYYGFGILNEFMKYEINPDVESHETPTSTGYSNYSSSYLNAIIKSTTYSPALYVQYFTSITERFHIAFDIISSYDFYKSSSEAKYKTLSTTEFPYGGVNGFFAPRQSDNKSELKKQFINIGMNPSIRFDIIKNFGMDLTFGSVQYRLKTKDSRLEDYEIDKKTQAFHINFTPKNWLLGFYYKL